MKNSQKIILISLAVVILVLIVGSMYYYLCQSKNTEITPINNENVDAGAWKTYKNTEFGFEITLPDSWKGYEVIKDSWRGGRIDESLQQETYTGPKIVLKNPQTTSQQTWQDIPIMVFTPNEWQLISDEKLAVSAAPIGPTAIGYNSKYVFATPPRWYGFTDTQGWQEAVDIVKTFRVLPENFPLSTSMIFNSEKLGIRFSYLSYDQQFEDRFSIKEGGNKLFISFDSRSQMSPRYPFITVLDKPADENLRQAVERIAFKNGIPKRCTIVPLQNIALRNGYQAMEIRPVPNTDIEREEMLCGENEYAAEFVSAYFLYNPQVPTKLLFINNGQDPFPSAPRQPNEMHSSVPTAAETIEIFK